MANEAVEYTTGRPRTGSWINVPAYGECRVLSNNDPSIVLLETPTGGQVRIGEHALRLALVAGRPQP